MRQRGLITQTRENQIGQEVSDAELTTRAAGGEVAAFEELYRRHVDAAWRVAQAVTGNSHDAADAVSDTFTRVFQALPTRLKDGGHFRPYLLASARNAAIDVLRRNGRLSPTEADEMDRPAVGNEPAELMVGEVDSSMVTRAFRSLPERWRSVLWLTEVEDIPPREAAGMLGMSPNGVAQLAVRARAGLRERFLQAHLGDGEVLPACRSTVDRLGAYVAGGLAPREVAKVDQHLAGCAACTGRQAQLAEIGPSLLRRAALPLPAGLAALIRIRWELAGAGTAAAATAGTSIAAGGGVVAGAAPGAAGLGGLAAAGVGPVAASVASMALFVAAVVGVGVVAPGPSSHPAPSVVAAADGSPQVGATFAAAAAGPATVEDDPLAGLVSDGARVPPPLPTAADLGAVIANAPSQALAEVFDAVTSSTPGLVDLSQVGVTLGLGVLDIVLGLGQGTAGCPGIRIVGVTIGCVPTAAAHPPAVTVSTGGLLLEVEVGLPELPAGPGLPEVPVLEELLAPLTAPTPTVAVPPVNEIPVRGVVGRLR
ncbi:MAG: sigma-70 family RNA polymerase sigma factor [Acidimicrobiales bacterium]